MSLRSRDSEGVFRGRRDQTVAQTAAQIAPVTDLEQPLRSLLGQIAPMVRANEYSVIIADDTSGRVPGLIMRWTINKYRAAHDLPKLPIVFLPGGGGRQYQTLAANQVFAERADLIRRLAGIQPGPPPTQRVLLVTDNISTGNTIAYTSQNLATLGLTVDVAAVGSRGDSTSISADLLGKMPHGSRFFLGAEKWTDIDGRHDISGVNKFTTTPVIREALLRRTVVASREAGVNMSRGLVGAIEPSSAPAAAGVAPQPMRRPGPLRGLFHRRVAVAPSATQAPADIGL